MDIEAKPIGNDLWTLTDLLGRPVGTITQTGQGFVIDCGMGSILEGVDLHAIHSSLDDAIFTVEKRTGGRCRLTL